jgi:hypothetical protein
VYVRLSQNGKVSPYMGLSARPGSGGNLIEVPWQTTPVTDVDLTQKVPGPVEGDEVVMSFEGPEYYGEIEWSTDSPSWDIVTFIAGQGPINYTAELTLTAKPGFTFIGANNFTHAVATRGIIQTDEGRPYTKNVTLLFKSTARVTDTSNIDRVVRPDQYLSRVSTLSSDQYSVSGDVLWYDTSHPHIALEDGAAWNPNQTYYYEFTLVVKDGYTFNGLTKNDFTIFVGSISSFNIGYGGTSVQMRCTLPPISQWGPGAY